MCIRDRSNTGKTHAFRSALIEKSPAMIGTVPMYDAIGYLEKALIAITPEDFLEAVSYTHLREPGERSRGRSSMPRLVSIDDVRARTAVPTLPDDDAPASRRGSSSSFRTMVDSSLPPQMTPEGTAAASAAASAVHHARSEGLNSLFESTTPPTDTRPTSSRGASASASGSRFTPSRTLKVVAPGAYNDAEAVSTALKLGNAVVLNLAATPDALAKRILDFSFGVASALDANVECVGNKVFALTRIDELTEAERSYLRTQGII